MNGTPYKSKTAAMARTKATMTAATAKAIANSLNNTATLPNCGKMMN